jgi:hypothetical protein
MGRLTCRCESDVSNPCSCCVTAARARAVMGTAVIDHPMICLPHPLVPHPSFQAGYKLDVWPTEDPLAGQCAEQHRLMPCVMYSLISRFRRKAPLTLLQIVPCKLPEQSALASPPCHRTARASADSCEAARICVEYVSAGSTTHKATKSTNH